MKSTGKSAVLDPGQPAAGMGNKQKKVKENKSYTCSDSQITNPPCRRTTFLHPSFPARQKINIACSFAKTPANTHVQKTLERNRRGNKKLGGGSRLGQSFMGQQLNSAGETTTKVNKRYWEEDDPCRTHIMSIFHCTDLYTTNY
jgi:hypothetical protein